LFAKLCFVGVDNAGALRANAAAGKQSFPDKCVTKLELGHEKRDGAFIDTKAKS
jgi:hypothetical protein